MGRRGRGALPALTAAVLMCHNSAQALTEGAHPAMLRVAPSIADAHAVSIKRGADGVHIRVTGNDPWVLYAECRWHATVGDRITLLYRCREDLPARLYWITLDDPRWDEAKTYAVACPSTEAPGTGASVWREIEVPVGLFAADWKGTITRLRFDPTPGNSGAELDLGQLALHADSTATSALLERVSSEDADDLADVRTGVDIKRATPYIENSVYRVELTEGRLSLLRRVATERAEGWQKVCDINVWGTMPDGRPLNTSTAQDTILSYARFEPCYPGERMMVGYRDAAADKGVPPYRDFCLNVRILPDAEPEFSSPHPIKLTTVPKIPTLNIEAHQESTDSQGYRLTTTHAVRLSPGVSILEGNVARLDSPSDGPAETTGARLPMSLFISSDFMDARLPVCVPRLILEVPPQAKVERVYESQSGWPLNWSMADGVVEIREAGPGTVRVKCDRLLDYRVLFNMPLPFKHDASYENFCNYHYIQHFILANWAMDEQGRPYPWPDEGLSGMLQTHPLPTFIGLHYGSHAPPGQFDTLYRLHPEIIQTDQHGNAHKGLGGAFGTPPWMCLVHPELRTLLRERLTFHFSHFKKQAWYDRVFAFGTTSEAWVVREGDLLFDYNPAFIHWFQEYERERWENDLKSFNRTFETTFASWESVDPPRVESDSAFYREWKLAKAEAVIASETFYRGEIFKRDPTRKNFAHAAALLIYNQHKTSITPDMMHVMKTKHPSMFKSGGSMYSADPYHIAYLADACRGYDPDEVSFPETYHPRYQSLYSYLVATSGLFLKSFSLMIPGMGWGKTELGDAWTVFPALAPLICLDMGVAERPRTALVFDLLSENHVALQSIHRALMDAHIDRCVVTTRMIEGGYLRSHPVENLVLPAVTTVSGVALREIRAAQQAGARILISGPFAMKDEYNRQPEDTLALRAEIVAAAVSVGDSESWRNHASPRADTPAPGVLLYPKSKGLLIHNTGRERVIDVALPSELKNKRLAVVSDTGQVLLTTRAASSLRVTLEAFRACGVVLCADLRVTETGECP